MNLAGENIFSMVFSERAFLQKSCQPTLRPRGVGLCSLGLRNLSALSDISSSAFDRCFCPRCSRDGPEFMDTYYRSSRLHFIGRWKARIEALQASMASAAPAALQPSGPGKMLTSPSLGEGSKSFMRIKFCFEKAHTSSVSIQTSPWKFAKHQWLSKPSASSRRCR